MTFSSFTLYARLYAGFVKLNGSLTCIILKREIKMKLSVENNNCSRLSAFEWKFVW